MREYNYDTLLEKYCRLAGKYVDIVDKYAELSDETDRLKLRMGFYTSTFGDIMEEQPEAK